MNHSGSQINALLKHYRARQQRQPIYCIWAFVSIFAFTTGLAADNLYQAGKRAYSGRNYAKAIELLHKAYRTNPSNGNPLFYIGRSYEDQRQRGQATSFYQRAVRLRMDRSLKEKAFWKIVLYHKHRMDWENLREYSNLFLHFQDIGQVRRLRDEAESKRDPTLARVKKLMNKARKFRQAKDLQTAKRIYRRVLQIQSSYKPARWELALLCLKANDYAAARDQLDWLIANDKPSWEYHYKATVCAYHQSQYENALQNLSKAHSLNQKPGKSFKYFTNYIEGLIRVRRFEWDQARTHLHVALKYKQDSATLIGNLALAEVFSGNLENGQKKAHRALEIEPHQHEARFALAEIARIRNRSAAYSHAYLLLKDLKKEPEKHSLPLYTPLLLYAGKAAAQKSDYKTAIVAYELVDVPRLMEIARARRTQNKQPDTIWDYNFNYGFALMHDGQLDRALNVLQKLEKNATSFYLIARVYALMENSTYARKHLAKAATLDENLWARAQKEQAFQKLMQLDNEFAEFVRLRGKEPEPALEKKPQPEPDHSSL